MPGSKYLSCRCAVSTFVANARPLLEVISEESKVVLRETNVLPLFFIPALPQNIPLLFVLVKLYRRDKGCFLLGNHYLKLTVNEVAMILGLPNRGRDFPFSRLPCSELSHKDLINEMRHLVNEEWSIELEQRRVNTLIRYLLIVFFFPMKTLKIPTCLGLLEDGIVALREYNWPKAIHAFLHSQLDCLSRANAVRDADTCLGYFEGCSIVALVRCRFGSVEDDEKRLLGPEETESDFEDMKPTKRKGRGVKKVKFEVESDFEDFEHEKEKLKFEEGRKKIAAKSKSRLLRRIEKEKKKVKRVSTGEDWSAIESRLRVYIREEVAKVEVSMKNFCETWFKKLQDGLSQSHRHAPSPTSSKPQTKVSPTSPTPPTSPTSPISPTSPTSPHIITLLSPAKKSSSVRVKNIVHRRKKDLKMVTTYPGKPHINPRIRDSIDFVLSEFKER
ncbi:hypothetical protein KSP39_PZI015727 [Platanthera zijinensis]|uniref:Aminotransferase-like plant mobile domain-containing protein n=1 Tax=Platanthera zijinensis TaxID=2320716 RepID=A0AAP0G213_9ASPA